MLPLVNPAVIYKGMSDGAVLFDPRVEIYFGLNEVGARVWQMLPPASSSLDEIVKKLAAIYPEVSEDTIRQDVKELLDQLVEQGLAVAPVARAQDAGADAARAS